MTAYSFGNRWVGIVGLRTPPPPEPLHKMALRLRHKSVTRSIAVDKNLRVFVDSILPSLARIRARLEVSGQAAKSQECFTVEQLIRYGRTPTLRSWLKSEIARVHAPKRVGQPVARKPAVDITPTGKMTAPPQERIILTGWDSSYPQAPESPWLPSVPAPLLRDLRGANLDLDESALLWVRWACLHRSFLYESVPQSPLSAEALDLLAMLGRGWVRLALLHRARLQRGDFSSSAEVSAVLQGDQQARSALGMWISKTGAASFGRGEASMIAAGRSSKASETVAMQILGALALVTASETPAVRLLELVSFEPIAPEPDWQALLSALLKKEPQFIRTDSGPDHNKVFTVTVEANGRSASASAGSVKTARKAATRSYILEHMPRAVPRPSARVVAKPQPYRAHIPAHVRACVWTQHAFNVSDSGLVSQAFTHRSWTHENQLLVAKSNQRDYGTLAAEGAEVLTNLVRHHYALQALNNSFQISTATVTSPAVTRDVVVGLFELMPVVPGVLLGRGTVLTPEIKADLTQAIAAAAWRGNGDLLMKRQPVTLSRWIHSFTPSLDPSTQLQEYCSRVKTEYLVDFEERGPVHQREYRATIIVDVEEQPRWRGTWCGTKKAAKHDAAGGMLSYLLGQDTTELSTTDTGGQALLRGMLLAELRTIDPQQVNVRRELAAGRLGVDLLAAGAYDKYLDWAVARSRLLPSSESAVIARLSQYYEAVLSIQRREAIRHWIIEYGPVRSLSSPEATEQIGVWLEGGGAGRLALLEALLTTMQKADPVGAVMEYVDLQAQMIAAASKTTLESQRSGDITTQTLTMRLPGAELSDTLEPVVGVVESVMGGATWAREPQAVSVIFQRAPAATDSVSQAGLAAVQRALRDPWLQRVQQALTDFLLVADGRMAIADDPSATELDEPILAEFALVLEVLR